MEGPVVILFCSICGRRMEGTWRKAKTGETGRVLYRCALRHNRAITQDFPEHPNTLYLSEDAILEPLDQWIASITSSEALAEHQGPSAQTTTSTQLRAKLAEVDRKIASLIAAIEAGVDLPLVSEQLNRRARERDGLEAEIRSLPRERVLSPTEMRQALDQLGGIANILAGADSSTREKIYNSLGVQMVYDHVARRVTVNATDACVHNRVRRGTCPLATQVLTIDVARRVTSNPQ